MSSYDKYLGRESLPNEEWGVIEGYEGIYEVSNMGRVWSITRLIKRKDRPNGALIKGRFLSQMVNGNGYAVVHLSKENKRVIRQVHPLVTHAFIGKRPNGYVIHHKDHNQLNNCVDNLEYVTRQKNALEYFQSIGKTYNKIPLDDIPEIIARVQNGEACKKIAAEYGVFRKVIGTIVRAIELPEKD